MKNFQYLKKSAGFTLIELLLYIAVLTIIISSVVIFSSWAIKAGTKTKINASVVNNARQATDTIIYEIRKSKGVYTPTSNFTGHPGQLSLEQASLDPTETATYIDFFLCGDSLCLKREDADPITITSSEVKISNLQFRQLLNSATAPSIQILMVIESLSSERPEDSASMTIQATANLRSYQND